MARKASRVIRVNGPIVIEWPDGTRIQLGPASSEGAIGVVKKGGRPPSPATRRLVDAMKKDAAKGGPRPRQDYLDVLRQAGGPRSDAAAGMILRREAKRIFGRPLGRAKAATPAKSHGRKPGPHILSLREKLHTDKAASNLRNANHYVRWLLDQPGISLGLKQARPIVYRELRLVAKTT